MSASLSQRQTPLLFKALRANGLFSILSGLVMLIAHRPVDSLIGLGHPLFVLATGVCLILFGVDVYRRGRQASVRRGDAIAISLLDLGWVLGTALIILMAPGLLSPIGNAIAVAIAVVVLVFFDLQVYALWRAERAPEHAAPLP